MTGHRGGLNRPYVGLHRVAGTQMELGLDGFEFTLTVEAWCAPFQRTGVMIEDLRVHCQTEGGTETFLIAIADWARR